MKTIGLIMHMQVLNSRLNLTLKISSFVKYMVFRDLQIMIRFYGVVSRMFGGAKKYEATNSKLVFPSTQQSLYTGKLIVHVFFP